LIPDSVLTLLFPHTFREFPYRRLILNLLRAAHILCLCFLVGGFVFSEDRSLLMPWIVATIASGLGIFLLDLYSSCISLFEVRGISVLIKTGLLGLIPFLDRNNQLYLLVALIIFSSLLSHSRRRLRHKSIMSKAFQDKYGIRE
jgi:hypothetical protein